MRDSLQTSDTLIQLTLTACIGGLALGQLVVGPISDARGRRRIIVAATIAFTVAGVVCALSTSVVLMIVALGFNIPMSIHQTGLMAQRRFTAQLVNRAIFAASVAVFSSAGIALFGLNGAALGLAASSLLQIPVVMYLLGRTPSPPRNPS